MYCLPDRFHADALGRAVARRTPCDYGVTPCRAGFRKPEYGFDDGYTAEVWLLQRFVLSDLVTDDPRAADLFLVPYLAMTDCLADPAFGSCWTPRVPRVCG